MTFSEISTEILDRLNLTSSEATTRVGRAINRVYRTVTTSLGMSVARNLSTSASTSIGSNQVTFTTVERLERVWITNSGGGVVLLKQVLLSELRGLDLPSSDSPSRWAVWSQTAEGVVIHLDAAAETVYTVNADGQTSVADLSGSNEPAFPESFHDVIIEGVLKDEYRKLERVQLARESETTFEKRMGELRFWLTKSQMLDLRQDSSNHPSNTNGLFGQSGAGGGGSGSLGSSAQTITALWTFDRDPSAPFAVTASSAVVTNLDADKVDGYEASSLLARANHTGVQAETTISPIATDRLLGRDTAVSGAVEQLTVGGGLEFTGSGGIQRSALTGDITASAGSAATTIANDAVTTAKILADNVTYAKIQNVSAASRLLGRGSAAGAGDVEEITAGSGLVISSTTLALISEFSISASVVSNILTLSLLSLSGNTPSATDPVDLWFRNVTAATGTPTKVQITGATTIDVPDTATLGTSNSVPFRVWVVAFNDAGTVRLGVINCSSSSSVYPLAAWGIGSSTAVTTGSDSSLIFYTGSAVTSKAYIVLGYVTYESGLATAGTWASAPTRVQAFTVDVPLPGRPVQQIYTSTITSTSNTSATYADSTLTATISPTSAANKVLARSITNGCYKDATATALQLKLLRDATQLAYQHGGSVGATIETMGSMAFEVLDSPATTSATIYKVQEAAEGGVGTVYTQEGSSQSSIVLTEIMS